MDGEHVTAQALLMQWVRLYGVTELSQSRFKVLFLFIGHLGPLHIRVHIALVNG